MWPQFEKKNQFPTKMKYKFYLQRKHEEKKEEN